MTEKRDNLNKLTWLSHLSRMARYLYTLQVRLGCTHYSNCTFVTALTGERVLHGGEHSEGTGPGDHRWSEPPRQHVPRREADHRLCGGPVLRLL